MSLWNCPKCGTLTGPEYGPCPKCGALTSLANSTAAIFGEYMPSVDVKPVDFRSHTCRECAYVRDGFKTRCNMVMCAFAGSEVWNQGVACPAFVPREKGGA